jgi:hypothetical protein
MEKTNIITLELTEEMQEALLIADEIFEEASEMGSLRAMGHVGDMVLLVRQIQSQLVAE